MCLNQFIEDTSIKKKRLGDSSKSLEGEKKCSVEHCSNEVS